MKSLKQQATGNKQQGKGSSLLRVRGVPTCGIAWQGHVPLRLVA
jgi:hypothetical protein